MTLFKRKAKKEAAAAPVVEPKSFVIIKNAPEKVDYMNDFAALPKTYGTKKYFDREDIKAIHDTVYAALDDLDPIKRNRSLGIDLLPDELLGKSCGEKRRGIVKINANALGRQILISIVAAVARLLACSIVANPGIVDIYDRSGRNYRVLLTLCGLDLLEL